MLIYRYQQITAPVGAFTVAVQQPSEWYPQQRTSTPAPVIAQRRNRSRISNVITVPPGTAAAPSTWEPRAIQIVRQPPRNTSTISHLVQFIAAPTPQPSEWHPHGLRSPPARQRVNRSDVAQLIQLVVSTPATTIDQWQLLDARYVRQTYRVNRSRVSNLITIPAAVVGATTIDQWQLLLPPRTPLAGRPNRAKIVNAVTYSTGNTLPEWDPLTVRYVPRILPKRAPGGELIQLITTIPATTIDQWQVLERRLRPTAARTNRSDVSQVLSLLPSAQTIDEWLPSERRMLAAWLPRVNLARLRTPISVTPDIPATTIDQWAPYERRVVPRAWAVHPHVAQTIQLIITSPATSIDQWNPYGPTQYGLRPPRRDHSVLPLLTGLEPTELRHWEPRATRRVPRAWAVHPQPSQTIQLIVIPPTSIREWEMRWARTVPRRYQPRRDGYLWALPFVEPPPAIITMPMVVFIAPARHQAVESTVDVLTFTAPARHQAVMSPVRSLTFIADARHQAVESTVDILIFTAPARHQAVISAARGGG